MDVLKVLLKERIKIPVQDAEQARAVQTALFSIGCGFNHGSELVQRYEEDWDILALAVNQRGMITCFVRNMDEAYYAESNRLEVKPDDLLTADLNALTRKPPRRQAILEARLQRKREIFLRRAGQPQAMPAQATSQKVLRQELHEIYHMTPGPERRLRLIATLTRDDATQGIAVNRLGQFNSQHDDDLKKLMKKGLLERARSGGNYRQKSSRSCQTYLVLSEAGWAYARERGLVDSKKDQSNAPGP